MEVLINNLQDKVDFSKELESLVEKVVRAVLEQKNIAREGEVSFALVDNEYIHQLNKQYRDKDTPTDVLSFPMDGIDSQESYLVLGDIIISLERAQEQAEEYNHSLEREIAFLTAHGMLHLLGFDHEVEEERITMEREQDIVLQSLGINR